MNLYELDNFFNDFLKKENYLSDPSRNGIQIQNSAPAEKQIKKIAFAVDASEQTAGMAAAENADVLVVHHGLFWGDCKTITGSMYKRISTFLKSDLALIAYHIPLDANNPYGNNFGIANKLELKNIEPFGLWRGMNIGAKGEFSKACSINEVAEQLKKVTGTECKVFDFGKKEIRTAGIISGGASEDITQAVEHNLDLYITGEFMHEDFHYAKEMKINVISGGHYGTETIGVSLLKEKVEKELGIQTVFIDFATGL